MNIADNKLEKIEGSTLSALHLMERNDLQEWIANDPSCLGKDLLIINKEYNGFDGTNLRLDLLALDKEGTSW